MKTESKCLICVIKFYKLILKKIYDYVLSFSLWLLLNVKCAIYHLLTCNGGKNNTIHNADNFSHVILHFRIKNIASWVRTA